MKLIAALVLLAVTPVAVTSVEKKREERLMRLKAEDGWLTLVGLHWLEPGTQTVGSAADNTIVLQTPNAAAHLGRLTVKADSVSFEPLAPVTIDGRAGSAGVLATDRTGAPTKIVDGSVTAYVIDRGGKLGLRVKDAKAPTRTNFHGLTYFASNDAWRLSATYEAYPTPKKVRVATLAGVQEEHVIPGKLHARHGDDAIDLEVFEDGDGLMVVFADKTSGHESYGACRFLYAAKPDAEGHVVLDFNLAESPPCAFTAFATCPLPPPGNRLKIRVDAGEKTPAGVAH